MSYNLKIPSILLFDFTQTLNMYTEYLFSSIIWNILGLDFSDWDLLNILLELILLKNSSESLNILFELISLKNSSESRKPSSFESSEGNTLKIQRWWIYSFIGKKIQEKGLIKRKIKKVNKKAKKNGPIKRSNTKGKEKRPRKMVQ